MYLKYISLMHVFETPEIAAMFAAEMQAEQRREARARREAARNAGVCWSGLGAAPHQPRDRGTLLAEATAKLARRHAWRESPPGAFLSAVVKAQLAARAAHEAGERARAAGERDETGEAAACAAAAQELEAQALLLLASAQAARTAAVRLAAPTRAVD
ncbi:hypothetical protein M9M90_14045 [Phenylobacterium sp. LH3H17]|uniref:hypothetical protein n=1 Tax=Phenylobacterium sp. LH3H17 TaxID=2903901 RepID=UPI0020C9BD58|nr:hypothetical protein [Phenylobacterium sp. LH3H17]UTP38333.1 hypothetical protein M9M90_14045 [Phenylobacterium sp. LH3H17]